MAVFLRILDTGMTRPENYGWFHLMFIGIMAVLCAVLIWKGRNWSDKGARRLALTVWIIMLCTETYKMINFNHTPQADGSITFDFQWYAFPFQMCSSPLYILPFVAFLPDGKARDGCISFLAFFSLFAGLSVYVYPNDVFISTIGINIQTMVHHGLQIVIGLFLCVHEAKKINFRFFLRGFIVFLIMVAIATVLNETVPLALPGATFAEKPTFNMFFISRHYPCTLPVLSLAADYVSSWLLPVLYAIGYFIAAGIVFAVARLCSHKARHACE